MRISREKLSSILQFYLQDMELEDKIMEAILDEEEDEEEEEQDNEVKNQ